MHRQRPATWHPCAGRRKIIDSTISLFEKTPCDRKVFKCSSESNQNVPPQEPYRLQGFSCLVGFSLLVASMAAAEVPLTELVGDQAGLSNSWALCVHKNRLIEYSYPWHGKQVDQRKLELILLSRDGKHYCLGVAKQFKKGGEKELFELQKRFAEKSVWKFSKVKLLTEKAAFVHTSCRIVIDLRKTVVAAMLQSPEFPRGPHPVTTVAQVTELRSSQRFDLIGIIDEILDQRTTTAGPLIEIRVIDGTKTGDNKTAAIQFVVWLKKGESMKVFDDHVRRTPVLFCALQGRPDAAAAKVTVGTVKDVFFWELAPWSSLAEEASKVVDECLNTGSSVVAAPPVYQGTERVDYINRAATFAVLSQLEKPEHLLAPEDEEMLYQVNFVALRAPTPSDTIVTENGDRLWTFTRLWDCTGNVELPFVSQAMLALAGLGDSDDEKYRQKHESGELAYPILASLRVRVKREPEKDGEPGRPRLTVMAAVPQDLSVKPNKSLASIVECMPERADRLAVVRLRDLRSSMWYNMTMGDGAQPIDKAMVILRSTEKSIGKNTEAGFRVQTDGVCDAMAGADDTDKYRIVANCTVEEFDRYQFPRGTNVEKPACAIAIVSKVLQATQSYHKAELLVEAMEVLDDRDVEEIISTFRRMSKLLTANMGNAPAEDSVPSTPVQVRMQNSCKKLKAFPTDASLPEG